MRVLSSASGLRPRVCRTFRSQSFQQCLYTLSGPRRPSRRTRVVFPVATTVAIGALVGAFYPTEFEIRGFSKEARLKENKKSQNGAPSQDDQQQQGEGSAWSTFASRFASLASVTDLEWTKLSDSIVSTILPEWSKSIPVYIRKLQGELSLAEDSLAAEIWREAHDPEVNPEIKFSAQVRVSSGLCEEEREFVARRKQVARFALARYLGLEEKNVHPEDVPTIAMCGSGGGLRALVAGTGSMLATEEDGLLDCVTYTAGVSGSCWLQVLSYSSLAECSMKRVLKHLKTRTGTHPAYPPEFLKIAVTAPTNKYILNGFVEKLKGDPNAVFGLVDLYGLLLAARYLVPDGELGVNGKDFKISNQREYVKFGQNPLPIYTAVHHEIPEAEDTSDKPISSASEEAKEKAKKESWFQWFEITPYEFFCEEFSAGIPTWAMGRRFKEGVDEPPESGFHLPEIRTPLLLGIFGSAFCATAKHYYAELRPIFRGLTGFASIDEMISGRNEDLSKVHPIDPATIPNFVYGMKDKLPSTTPESICNKEHIKLMDAGMSNNLPIYPLLRPGREVDVLIAFDASADIKKDNWLSVTDGYARQRGIRGWPVGIGWPKGGGSPEQALEELEEAQVEGKAEAKEKIQKAKEEQIARRKAAGKDPSGEEPSATAFKGTDEKAGDLGYCTVWVGTTQERKAEPPPPPKAIDDKTKWQLSDPAAGIAVVYMPLLTNPKVPGVNPGETEFLSTWNMVYTPEQVEQVADLARANYAEGRDQIKGCVRAVYERKKKLREEREEKAERARYGAEVRRGMGTRLGEGDHFS